MCIAISKNYWTFAHITLYFKRLDMEIKCLSLRETVSPNCKQMRMQTEKKRKQVLKITEQNLTQGTKQQN